MLGLVARMLKTDRWTPSFQFQPRAENRYPDDVGSNVNLGQLYAQQRK
jgi:hypothetical protein